MDGLTNNYPQNIWAEYPNYLETQFLTHMKSVKPVKCDFVMFAANDNQTGLEKKLWIDHM